MNALNLLLLLVHCQLNTVEVEAVYILQLLEPCLYTLQMQLSSFGTFFCPQKRPVSVCVSIAKDHFQSDAASHLTVDDYVNLWCTLDSTGEANRLTVECTVCYSFADLLTCAA